MQVIMEQLKNPTQPKQTPIHKREINELKLCWHVFQLMIKIVMLAFLSVGLSWRMKCSETCLSWKRFSGDFVLQASSFSDKKHHHVVGATGHGPCTWTAQGGLKGGKWWWAPSTLLLRRQLSEYVDVSQQIQWYHCEQAITLSLFISDNSVNWLPMSQHRCQSYQVPACLWGCSGISGGHMC